MDLTLLSFSIKVFEFELFLSLSLSSFQSRRKHTDGVPNVQGNRVKLLFTTTHKSSKCDLKRATVLSDGLTVWEIQWNRFLWPPTNQASVVLKEQWSLVMGSFIWKQERFSTHKNVILKYDRQSLLRVLIPWGVPLWQQKAKPCVHD